MFAPAVSQIDFFLLDCGISNEFIHPGGYIVLLQFSDPLSMSAQVDTFPEFCSHGRLDFRFLLIGGVAEM